MGSLWESELIAVAVCEMVSKSPHPEQVGDCMKCGWTELACLGRDHLFSSKNRGKFFFSTGKSEDLAEGVDWLLVMHTKFLRRKSTWAEHPINVSILLVSSEEGCFWLRRFWCGGGTQLRSAPLPHCFLYWLGFFSSPTLCSVDSNKWSNAYKPLYTSLGVE